MTVPPRVRRRGLLIKASGVVVVGCTDLTVTGNAIHLHNPKEKTVQLTNVDRTDVR